MKRILMIAACVLGLALTATADPVEFQDQYWIGYAQPGAPASEAAVAGYINNLIDLAINGTASIDGQDYSRVGSTIDASGFPDAVATGAVKVNTNTENDVLNVNVSGFTYLTAKYDADNPGAGIHVWYVAGLNTVDIPGKGMYDKYGLSNYILFNPTTTPPPPPPPPPPPVPDGGLTLTLLGAAVAGLAVMRGRFSS